MTNSGTQKFPGIAEFLFNIPLYNWYAMSQTTEVADLCWADFKVDGHCYYCNDRTTFSRFPSSFPSVASGNPTEIPDNVYRLIISCARKSNHRYLFYILKDKKAICKIGQHPSLADIKNDDLRRYNKVLTGLNASEFRTANGLAAHGVGIGAFAYLRRVFERLIHSCFSAHAAEYKWMEDDFQCRSMQEKVEMLKPVLPSTLLEYKQIYGILSKGIHELTEEDCLTYFQPLQLAIIIILESEEEERRKKQQQNRLKQSIEQISHAEGARAKSGKNE